MVEVHAAAIKPIDWIVMGSMEGMLDYDLPWIGRDDVARGVAELGAVCLEVLDQRSVFDSADNLRAGTMAEYCAVKESDLALRADCVSQQRSAGVPLAGLTAGRRSTPWPARITSAVLIRALSGGVDLLAIQVAEHTGACVATTASAHTVHDDGCGNMICTGLAALARGCS